MLRVYQEKILLIKITFASDKKFLTDLEIASLSLSERLRLFYSLKIINLNSSSLKNNFS